MEKEKIKEEISRVLRLCDRSYLEWPMFILKCVYIVQPEIEGNPLVADIWFQYVHRSPAGQSLSEEDMERRIEQCYSSILEKYPPERIHAFLPDKESEEKFSDYPLPKSVNLTPNDFEKMEQWNQKIWLYSGLQRDLKYFIEKTLDEAPNSRNFLLEIPYCKRNGENCIKDKWTMELYGPPKKESDAENISVLFLNDMFEKFQDFNDLKISIL